MQTQPGALIGMLGSLIPTALFVAIARRYPSPGELIMLAIASAPIAGAVAWLHYRRQAPRRRLAPADVATWRGAEPARYCRLVSLLYGDEAAARRLLATARRQHPRQPPAWLIDKVISDLLADRAR